MNGWVWTAVMLAEIGVAGCRHGVAVPRNTPGLTVRSTSFAGTIPVKYASCDGGKNMSPELAWSAPPAGTKSIAVLVDDPDAPLRGGFVHWLVFNLPPETRELTEDASPAQLPAGARESMNGFDRVGYGGPCPPAHQVHRYIFHVYALDKVLDLPASTAPDALEKALTGHVLAHGELIGRFGK